MLTCLRVDAANTEIKEMTCSDANAREHMGFLCTVTLVTLAALLFLPKEGLIKVKSFLEIKGHGTASRNHRKNEAGGWNKK